MSRKKILKSISIILFIFAIGVIASFFAEHYIFPWLSSTKLFNKYQILKKAGENVTIINKTEQVTVREEDSVSTIASKALPAMVNIISIANETSPVKNAMAGKSGTGIIATGDGMIIAYSESILKDASKYVVITNDGSKYEGKLIGIDDFSDLAFLKIELTNLSVISFADSSDFRPGKKLVAISNSAEEYQNKFEAGLLSGINKTFNIGGKTVSSSEKMEGVLELDFGHMTDFVGSAVINYNGELAGIIGREIIDNKDEYFLLPSSSVKQALERSIKNGASQRPFLGLYYLPVTTQFSIVNNLGRDRGALIYSPSGKKGLAIISGTPAERAGLEIDDIIIAVNGREINLDNPLSNAISEYKAGDELEFLIDRSGREMNIKVKL